MEIMTIFAPTFFLQLHPQNRVASLFFPGPSYPSPTHPTPSHLRPLFDGVENSMNRGDRAKMRKSFWQNRRPKLARPSPPRVSPWGTDWYHHLPLGFWRPPGVGGASPARTSNYIPIGMRHKPIVARRPTSTKEKTDPISTKFCECRTG